MPCNVEHVPITLSTKKNKIVFHLAEELKKIENSVVNGFLQNCARLKKVCKKTSETNVRQSSLRGVKRIAPFSTSN